MCEQGADKEEIVWLGNTALLLAAQEGHIPVAQYLCEQRADTEAGMLMKCHHCTWKRSLATALWWPE